MCIRDRKESGQGRIFCQVARISGKVGDCSDKEMNSRRFYLTLPSNASMNLYPKNTAAQYTIKLPRSIALDGGDWEVALTELSVPAIFDNVLKNTCYVKLIDERTDTMSTRVKYISFGQDTIIPSTVSYTS